VRITNVQTVLLTGPATLDPFLVECRYRRSVAFIEIHTDAGLIGLGETYAGYFCPELVPGVVDFFQPILLGQTVDDIDELWRRMYHCGNFWCRVGLGLAVLTGIEAALWDLRGKLEGRPVYELLGGLQHESLRAYATGGPANYPLDRLAAKIDAYLSWGFHAVKVAAGAFRADRGFEISNDPQEAADLESSKLEFLRRHAGAGLTVMLDGHMGNSPAETWTLATAQAVMRAVAPFGLLFFEEPLQYTDPWSYAELCRSTEVPIAGGECLTGVCEWRVFTEGNCFDIGQPDASFTGGLGQFMRVASLFEARGRQIATHSWGAGGSLLQNIHCAFAAKNTLIVEVPPAFGPLHSETMADAFRMVDGRLLPPQTPGLGIVLTETTKQRFPFVPGSGEFNSVPGKIMEEERKSA
jgi:L-alanine-DL-glutamate epimerase-like enolase superfamily enzyme